MQRAVFSALRCIDRRPIGIGVGLAAIAGALVATSGAATVRNLPDLVEATVSSPPAVVLPGGSFRLADRVKNRGRATARATTTNYYLEGGHSGALIHTLEGSRRVPALNVEMTSKGSRLVKIARTVPGGMYSIRVCADERHVAKESNEENNCLLSRMFRVKR